MMRFLTLAKERPGEGHCRQRKAKRQGCFRRTVRPEGNGGFIQDVRLLFAVQEKPRDGEGIEQSS